MAEDGLDVRTWLTILGVFVVFFLLPAFALEYDRRRKPRADRQEREG